jgi:hypothetical protein
MRAALLAAAGADKQRAHRVQIDVEIGGVTLEELLMGAVLLARRRSRLPCCSGLGVRESFRAIMSSATDCSSGIPPPSLSLDQRLPLLSSN